MTIEGIDELGLSRRPVRRVAMTATSSGRVPAAWASVTSGGASSWGPATPPDYSAAPPLEVRAAATPCAGQRRTARRTGVGPARDRVRRQHREGIEWSSSSKAVEGSRVVLAQGVAQRVGLALSGPDEVLVGPGEDLDGT